jgi:predicted Zn-dependent protease
MSNNDRPGRFNDGRTAASRTVTVRATASGLEIWGADGFLVAKWKTADLRADGSLPNGAGVRLRCAAEPDARLVIDDAVFIGEALPDVAKKRRRFSAALPVSLVLGMLSLVGLVFALPYLAREAARLVPAEMEQAWGRQIAAGLSAHSRVCRGPAGEQALSALTTRLAGGLAADRRTITVTVLDAPVVNAVALPGGQIVVFRGLLDQADGPDELAGILGHELTHVGERHPAAALIRGMGVGILATLLTGDASGLMASGAATLLATAYSRDDEDAADRGGVALLQKAGIGSAGFSHFFRKQEAHPQGMPAWIATHSKPKARADAVEALGAAGLQQPALDDDEWRAVKGMCGS